MKAACFGERHEVLELDGDSSLPLILESKKQNARLAPTMHTAEGSTVVLHIFQIPWTHSHSAKPSPVRGSCKLNLARFTTRQWVTEVHRFDVFPAW